MPFSLYLRHSFCSESDQIKGNGVFFKKLSMVSPILDVVETNVCGDDSGQERHEGSLLKLINQDWSVTLAGGSNG